MRAKVVLVLSFFFFSISSARAGNQKVLYSFTGGAEGGSPYSGVVFDSAGRLYGVTEWGGEYGRGVVFQLTPSSSGEWTETVLHSFTGWPDGGSPGGGLVIDRSGSLYGVTSMGGEPDYSSGCGTVFRLSPSDSGWTFSVMHSFAGGNGGCSPQSDLSLSYDNTLWGTVAMGGAGEQGGVFRLSTTGTGYVLSSFFGASGMGPGGLGLFPRYGNVFVYGTTLEGGMEKVGNIFDLIWANHIAKKYGFTTAGKAGYYPMGNLATQVVNDVWIMYGTTSSGGTGRLGTVYQLTKSQIYYDSWRPSVIHSFSGLDGGTPVAGPVLDSEGNLYGTTQWAGADPGYAGTVYKLTPGANNKWTHNLLYSFTGGADGRTPASSVAFDSAGNVYGTTYYGGAYGAGVVYEIVKTTGVVRPATLTFGPQPLNTTSPAKRISLFNRSSVPISVNGVSAQGEFAVSANKCQSGVLPNTHCDVYVTFTPTGLGTKPRTGTLTFVDSAFNGPQTAQLSGTIPAVTSTTVTTSGSPSLAGQPVTFTAVVTTANGTVPDGDLVTFFDWNLPLGSAAVAGGMAAFSTAALPASRHMIKAAYAGDPAFEPSVGKLMQVLDKYSTTTSLSSSWNPSMHGQAVTFTATVTSANPTLTGKVWFKDGTTGFATVTLNGGAATVVTPKLAVGSHAISAEYIGDDASAKSTSSVLDQMVK